jgi:hypothetical protein
MHGQAFRRVYRVTSRLLRQRERDQSKIREVCRRENLEEAMPTD